MQSHQQGNGPYECLVDGEAAPVRTRRDQLLPADLGGQDVQRLDLDIASAGAASVRLVARGGDRPAPSVLVVRDAAGLVASAHVDTHALLADRGFHLVAQVEREGAPVRGVERATVNRWPAYSPRSPPSRKTRLAIVMLDVVSSRSTCRRTFTSSRGV